MTDLSQFNHLGGYGRAPRKGEPKWSCIAGIAREGARVPGACNHLRYRAEPLVIFGISPIEAGRLATERADQGFDLGRRRRRLRRDGVAFLAGVVSYPLPKKFVEGDPSEKDAHRRWRDMTLNWLIKIFGEHLQRVVEHADENFLHLHYYVVPKLLPDDRLNLHEIHPGRRMKRDAAETGASKKDQDAAYRSGMSRFQDDFYFEVSRNFGHDRDGPRRMRVSRMQHKMQTAMEQEGVRQQVAFAAERAAFDREIAQRRAELDREYARRMAEADQRERQSAEANADLRAACTLLKGRFIAERAGRQAAEALAAALQAQLAEQHEDAPLRFVA